MAAADAGAIFAARCRDVATLNVNDSTRCTTISAADARAKAVAAGIERARASGFALDGERIVLWYIDTGIVLIESLHGVCRAVGKDDGGMTLAGDACPLVIRVVHAADVHAAERHRGIVGYRDLHGITGGIERARYFHSVIDLLIALNRCKVERLIDVSGLKI